MAKQFFRITGDAVELVTERVERTVSLHDLLAEVTREAGFTTPILPAGCRLYRQQGERSVFVIEQMPAVRTLNWRGMGEGDKWKLGFPYVIFVISFSGGAVSTAHVFYRTSPLGNGDDALCRTNLCNVYTDAHICTGNMRVEGHSAAQKAESFVAGFWGSVFNTDLWDNNFRPAAAIFPQVANLAAWQAATEQNPLFPLGVQWLEFGSLTDVVEGRA